MVAQIDQSRSEFLEFVSEIDPGLSNLSWRLDTWQVWMPMAFGHPSSGMMASGLVVELDEERPDAPWVLRWGPLVVLRSPNLAFAVSQIEPTLRIMTSESHHMAAFSYPCHESCDCTTF